MRLRHTLIIVGALLSPALAGCGSGSFAPSTANSNLPSGQPGRGKPAVTLGDKNFTEQYILGQLYAQALRAKGYTIRLKANIGASGATDAQLTTGQIDLYPEYTGVIVSALANIVGAAPGADAQANAPPGSARQAYQQAAAFEDRRGLTLLDPTPFQDADRIAVRPAYAHAHRLHSLTDLKKLPSFTYGAPPENRTRYEGLQGMKQAYGLSQTKFVAFPIGAQYAALNTGRVDTIAVFTTDGRLQHHNYTILTDPKNIFGYQNEAPVVNKNTLKQQGPAFAQTLNAVSIKLTTQAMQHMNAQVDLEHHTPANVAQAFLMANGLL